MTAAPDEAYSLNAEGQMIYAEHPVAQMVKGADWLGPIVELLGAGDMPVESKAPALARMQAWLDWYIAKRLPAHVKLKSGENQDGLEGHAKGIAFRIMESGAAIDLREDDPSLRVEAEQREILKALGLRSGRLAAHAPDAQKPAAQRLVAHLRTLFDGAPCPVAPEGAGSFGLDGTWPDEALLANGYLRFGPRAVRADLAERLAWEIAKRRKEAEKNLFALPPELASIVSCPGDTFPTVLKGFGLVPAEKDPETGIPTLWRYGRRQTGDAPRARGRHSGDEQKSASESNSGGARPPRNNASGRHKPHNKSNRPPPRREKQADPDSPFAALAALIPAEKPKKRKPKSKRPKPEKGAVPTPTQTDASSTPAPNSAPSAPPEASEVVTPATPLASE
jgi:ATP-dependent RNA helicase SUPV3L1/SUV3